MPIVRWGEQAFGLQDNETVLDGLLRHDAKVSYSCKSGSCGSCMLQAREGTVPARAQAGLKDSWTAQGYFLACVCVPETDLTVAPLGSDARIPATILSLGNLSPSVKQVLLRRDVSSDIRPGQYLSIVRRDGLARSYSVAGIPEEDVFELHVRLIPNGRMSGWLHHEACVGDRVSTLGPSGECFYVPGREDQPLLLAGTGTGLSPLWGVLRDALRGGHRGSIHVFHGAMDAGGLYLCHELRELAELHGNLSYTPVVLSGDPASGTEVGAIDKVVLQRLPRLAGWRTYLAGDPDMVRSLKLQLFLAGVASRDIFADAFLHSAA